ncbi:MAG: FeoA family protein [Candidatus Margulisbacteria bacterium]|nr:FeoA family protein [Candidatus Margulisiibacteriota bacterium]
MNKLSLDQMDSGQSGIVEAINGGQGTVRRLEALGLKVGKRITKISSMIMRGPITIRVGGTQIAIGCGLAEKIMVAIK